MSNKLLLNDDPISEKDGLIKGLHGLSQQITDLLQESSDNFPILVNGDWGAGKTSLLKSIKKELEVHKVCPIIWFEAWHYEKTDGLLPALMRRVWESTPNKFRNMETAKKLAGSLWKASFAATTLSIPAVLKAFGVPLLPSLIENLNSKTVGGAVDAVPSREDTEPPKDAGDELREKLTNIITAAWPKSKTPIVFIDDLDRCTPEGTVQLLDAVRMLMNPGETNSMNLRFVVALDQTIAVRAISAKFAGIGDYDGNRYLEKLFPIGFHIPPPDVANSADLIKKLLEKVETLSDDRRDCLVEALINPSFANPRLMKRSINKFILVCRQENTILVSHRSSAKYDVSASERKMEDNYLAKWIAAAERWPQLRPLVQKRDLPYWEQFFEALKSSNEKKLTGPDAASLMAQPGAKAWLQNENFLDNFKGFKQAEQRLSRYGL